MKKTPLLDMDRGVLNIDLFVYCVMLPQGESPLRRRQGGFPVAPLTPSARSLPCYLVCIAAWVTFVILQYN